ncbi:MAG: lantibiotic dehydratase [Lewinellaceae bacterium]|nr:lantibiotic dehydratase [Lewinellaceae bacterium]
MPTPGVFSLMLIRSAGLPFSTLNGLAADWKTLEKALEVGRAKRTEAASALQEVFDSSLQALAASPLRTQVYNCRKAFFQKEKLPGDQILTQWASANQPALELLCANVASFRQAEKNCIQAEHAFAEAYETAVQQGFSKLQKIAQTELFQRALLFASHSLLGQLPRFTRQSAAHFGKKERQVAFSILQYVARMATKTTPLGYFNTVSVQALGDDPDTLPFGKTLVVPNVALLEAFYAVLLRASEFYRALPVRLNPCITASGGDRYNWLYFDGETESFQEAEATGLLHLIVEFFLENEREYPFERLMDQLETSIDAERADLETYILNLVDIGLLEWVLPETGLSANWCGALYQFLGFLTPTHLIVETATLLQWLRNTARTLPYQPLDAALESLEKTREELSAYFDRYGLEIPSIPLEQLFYVDVEQSTPAGIPEAAVHQVVDDLADCWAERPSTVSPQTRVAWLEFVREKTVEAGKSVGFLELCQAFLKNTLSAADIRPAAPTRPTTSSRRTSASPQKIGALIQPFQENGQWYAVINSLYPGGGKLFARWLPLFSSEVTDALRTWYLNVPPQSKAAMQFPWQGFFNANNQPHLAADVLLVPGGRTRPTTSSRRTSIAGDTFHLGNLKVQWENDAPVLRDGLTGQLVELVDLGLEAPETRPPVMQLLWQLGVPYISTTQLLPDNSWQLLEKHQVLYRRRLICRGLVIAREAWRVEETVWKSWLESTNSEFDFFEKIRRVLAQLNIPRHFFANLGPAKPQYFDSDSPLFMQLFRKNLDQGGGVLRLTEMLPVPEGKAQEIAIEFFAGG